MPLTLDKNTALVLIDLQHGTTSAELAHPLADVVTRAAQLLAAFRAKGRPVVIVTVNPAGSDQSRIRTQAPGPPAQLPAGFDELLPEIRVEFGDVRIHKQTWNAFYRTPLHDELERLGVTGIVLAGVSTSIGVEGTARAAAERGYNIAFATDAMTDRVAAAHANSLQYIFPRLGQLGTTDELLAEV
ncbi:isochorismatase family protein [Hymenobacter sp. RP-2-7]|uniref:Isochorismatase family protein n=1 Tax=Hymenobacter polaris TaxID=2682546 RepID=A0A7Y0ADA3_9BACT|nr:isochorismatase family protein [Hymenobacter polaris]NML65214.1 isochorismatase family protein [Hymenobacter polaris]